MLATVFAEHFGIRPAYAHAVQVGGASGLAMTMLAHHLVDAGVVKHVLVVAGETGVRVRGCAQAHTHQHVTAAPALSELGAEIAIARAMQASGVAISDVRYAAVYDSFTVTLAMLLEDLGLAGRGEAASRVRSGYFSRDGAMPLNTQGGLLSYGHCGVGGAMAHLVETHLQMTGRATEASR